jgi:hypothetical protein
MAIRSAMASASTFRETTSIADVAGFGVGSARRALMECVNPLALGQAIAASPLQIAAGISVPMFRAITTIAVNVGLFARGTPIVSMVDANVGLPCSPRIFAETAASTFRRTRTIAVDAEPHVAVTRPASPGAVNVPPACFVARIYVATGA